MCANMTAHHLPCGHLHHWFARCFFAKSAQQPACNMLPFLHYIYAENFRCPACRAALTEWT